MVDAEKKLEMKRKTLQRMRYNAAFYGRNQLEY